MELDGLKSLHDEPLSAALAEIGVGGGAAAVQGGTKQLSASGSARCIQKSRHSSRTQRARFSWILKRGRRFSKLLLFSSGEEALIYLMELVTCFPVQLTSGLAVICEVLPDSAILYNSKTIYIWTLKATIKKLTTADFCYFSRISWCMETI